MPGDGHRGQHAGVERPGADDHLVGLGQGLGGLGGRAGAAGDQRHPPDPARRRHRHLPSTSPRSASALRVTFSVVAGSTRPTPPAARPRRRCRRPGPRWRPPARPAQVAQGVAGQLAGLAEAVLEGPGQHRGGVGQGHQALAQVPQGHHVELLAQAAARAAVVGHRDHGRDLRGVAPERPEGHGRAVPAAHGHDPGARGHGAHRSTSRWKDEEATPWAASRSTSASARATERWRPPVQPMATVR